MLRTRGNVLLSVLQLVAPPSTRTLISRSYNVYRQTLAPNVEPPMASDLLSKLSTLMSSDPVAKLTDIEAETHNHRLASFRGALGTRNLIRIWETYEDLVRHSSAAAIMARDFEELSRVLEKHFSQCPSAKDIIDGASKLAVEAAARGQTAGLRACMLLHLREGDVQSVLSNYVEFDLLAQDVTTRNPEQPAIAQHTADMNGITDLSKRRLNISGMADLVLTVLAAYASENRFDDALDRFLATPLTVRLPRPKVQAFCWAHMRHDLALSEKMLKWCDELVLLRLVSWESSLNNHISNLGQDKQIVPLERLYTSIISECRKVDRRLMIRTDSSPGDREGSKRRVIVMPSDAWSTFMQAFFKCHRADLVEKLWNDVEDLGLSHNRRMWTALLDGYGRHGHCEKAIVIWNRMLDQGVEPDEISYGAMASAYFLAHRPKEGLALFEQLRRGLRETAEGRQSLSDPAMLPLYNIVLHGLCINAMDGQARSVLNEMVEQGPKPDIVSYNTFLRHYGRIGDMKGLAAVLRALKPAGIRPDVHSFTTILSALYKAGKPDAHKKTIQIMHTMGVRPNVATYSAIIDFLVRQGGEANFHYACELLQMMESDPSEECRPNEVTYTSLLAGLHRDSTISAQNVKMHTADLLGRMRQHGRMPNRTTYHILIKACLENPGTDGVKTALGYYREMEKRSIKLLNDTWYVMLAGLLRRGDLAMAGEILEDMFKVGHEPVGALLTLVGRVQEETALASARGFV